MKNCGFHFNTTYTSLPQQLFSKLRPSATEKPKLIIMNDMLAESLGLNFSELSTKEQTALFSGNDLPEEVTPFSQAYAGHQFGYFNLLGDGRAHLWGEHITPAGERFDIQFKGSGRTPYSRSGDGKATLGPMLREYIISEAMYYLDIPTTRSLAIVETGERIMRESLLSGALLTRVARSHIRVGTFEFAAYLENRKTIEVLMNYTIKRHYPELSESPNKALALIHAVIERQIDLIVHWMRVGFIHGVMNTDNMTLSGETIDYGPCAFMDAYDSSTVYSSIDYKGRYAYANQPKIAQWNIARFAETLLPLICNNTNKAIELAEEAINQFSSIYQQKWLAMMRSKLGLLSEDKSDEQLISTLLDWMHKNDRDYTITFHDLTQKVLPNRKVYGQPSFQKWYLQWQKRLDKNAKKWTTSLSIMRKANPVIIPRNHIVEQVLDAASNGDYKPFRALLAVLKTPYKDCKLLQPYQTPPTESERIYQTFCGT